MISVTVVASRRRQILFVVKRLRVDAQLVVVKLVRGNAKRFHVVGARMTFRASRCDVARVNRRKGIVRRANAVHAVTTDAGRDARLAFLFQQTAVDARVVFPLLIDAQAGIEALH